MKLATLIMEARDEIAERFANRLFAGGAAEGLDREDVIDSLREFLDALGGAMVADLADGRERSPSPPPGQVARVHGMQRVRLGYEVGAVIREYGTVRELVIRLAEERGVVISVEELTSFTRHLASSVAEAAVAYANTRDEELRRRTAQHLGFLAHELRNLLGSALIAHNLMEAAGQLPKDKSAALLLRSLRGMARLIDDSLIESRLELAGELHRETIDIAPFIAELVDESAADAEHKGTTFAVEASGQVNADRRVLRSALTNLIRNAVKFSVRGHAVHIRAKLNDGRVVFEVEDACGGLPPGTTDKLFDPHVQAGADKSGFGLGLAIAKLAASAHRGELRVHDLPGKGCVFLIDLPASG